MIYSDDQLKQFIPEERIKKARNLPDWVKFIKLSMIIGLVISFLYICDLLVTLYSKTVLALALPLFFIWMPLYFYLFNRILYLIKPIRIGLNKVY
jgi:hypothetical protein